MKLDAFLAERTNDWDEAERLLQKSKGRLRKLNGTEVLRAADLYRLISTDMVFLRQQKAGGTTTARVSTIVRQLHRTLFRSQHKPASLATFFHTTYWQRIAEKPAILWLAIVLMIAPAVAIFPWSVQHPYEAVNILPGQFQQTPDRSIPKPTNGGFGNVPLTDRTALSAEIFINNIKVAFFAFAGGMTLGLFTTYIYLINSFMLGVVIALASYEHDVARTISLLTPHGVLELSCILVAAYAGYRVAWSIIHPGNSSRTESVKKESRAAGELALGTAACLIVAGLVEGLITPSNIGFTAKYVIGVTLGVAFWGMVVVRGRRGLSRPDKHKSPPPVTWLEKPASLLFPNSAAH